MHQAVKRHLSTLPFVLVFLCASHTLKADDQDYGALLELFQEWRSFETPPTRAGVPDYTAATFAARRPSFDALQRRLMSFGIDAWPVEHQVDWHLVRAEMNGYDFNDRILRPWVRDPAFYNSVWDYRSDVPAHEGPTHHAVIELWQYSFPLTYSEAKRLARELAVIPGLIAQAQENLTGNAKDLWITGIRDIRQQRDLLQNLHSNKVDKTQTALLQSIKAAIDATDTFINWLESESASKTGPSGIGKDNYTWYQQNVHLLPMTWEDEVRLLERELARAWSSLKLEEQRNRKRPQLTPAANPSAYQDKANAAVDRIMRFLEVNDVLTITDDMRPALLEHMGKFIPEEQRNFFWITAHLDPAPLFTHFYHWFELARMDARPHASPVRQGALLYNIFDSRNEGTATGVEEMFMHAGLYDDSPRSRELVWILLAQRAARGLGSLHAHANEMTMAEAGRIHMDYTPRGWMSTEEELLIFEQHLYLRQPGYGTSYVTGKYLLEKTLADAGKLAESHDEAFSLRQFFDQLNAIDSIPIWLARWEMTGMKAGLGECILCMGNEKEEIP